MQQIHAHNEDRKVLKKLKLYRKVKLASDVNPNYIKHSTSKGTAHHAHVRWDG